MGRVRSPLVSMYTQLISKFKYADITNILLVGEILLSIGATYCVPSEQGHHAHSKFCGFHGYSIHPRSTGIMTFS